jgi:hypothetical protein
MDHLEKDLFSPVEEVVRVGVRREEVVGVCSDLDVTMCLLLALHVPPQHATAWGAALPATGAEHDPAHSQRWVHLVLVQQALQSLLSASNTAGFNELDVVQT